MAMHIVHVACPSSVRVFSCFHLVRRFLERKNSCSELTDWTPFGWVVFLFRFQYLKENRVCDALVAESLSDSLEELSKKVHKALEVEEKRKLVTLAELHVETVESVTAS